MEYLQNLYDKLFSSKSAMLQTTPLYPKQWPVLYTGSDGIPQAAVVLESHFDVDGSFYTIKIIETGVEKQTTKERLKSYVDKMEPHKIREIFDHFVRAK